MNKYYPHLFSSIKVGRVTFKNRIMYAPHWGVTNIKDGVMTEESHYFFEERAMGGPAILSAGENPVNGDPFVSSGRFWFYEDLDSPGQHENTKGAGRFVAELHRHGVLAEAEINHFGKVAATKYDGCGISAMDGVTADGHKYIAMTREMMDTLCDEYASSIERMADIGFDAVALHAGHGWIWSQFLSKRENQRTDEFGGSLENRARFPLMILNRIRQRVGDRIVIELRLSWEDGLEDGINLPEMLEFAKMVDGLVDIIHVSVGNHSDEITRGESRTISPAYYPNALNADAAAEFKKVLKKSLVTVVGAINDPQMAEDIIASGKADFVSVARQNIADPYFARKSQQGLDYEIDNCIRCMKCYHRRDLKYTAPTCSVNPLFGQESVWTSRMRRTDSPKRVAVIGGGPAGMKAAVTAAKEGHIVTLFEKSSHLGGTLHFAEKDEYKKDIDRFLKSLAVRCEKNGVDVRLDAEATPELIESGNFHSVIACVGAEPIIPPIPGIDGKNVMHALDAYNNLSSLGENIVIIGGGMVGCEAAMHFGKLGHKVTVIEKLDALALEAEAFPHAVILRMMEDNGCIGKTGLTCTGITDGAVTAVDDAGNEHTFAADTVIYAVGMRPRAELAQSFMNISEYYTSAGDCVRAAALREAIRDGYYAALDIDRV